MGFGPKRRDRIEVSTWKDVTGVSSGGVLPTPRSVGHIVKRPLWLRAVLLASVLLFILLQPLVGKTFLGRALFDILFTWILISGLWNLSRDRNLLIAGLCLGVPTFLADWALYLVSSPILIVTFHVFAGLFLAFIAGSTVALILQANTVTTETIFSAVAVYLLLGLAWALAFELIEYLHRGSFLLLGEPLGQSAAASQSESFPVLVYYSLATLTTLGYGDIVPATPLARALAAPEAVAGQLYIAILIAQLVAVHTSQRAGRA
jgi:Ion channel